MIYQIKLIVNIIYKFVVKMIKYWKIYVKTYALFHKEIWQKNKVISMLLRFYIIEKCLSSEKNFIIGLENGCNMNASICVNRNSIR